MPLRVKSEDDEILAQINIIPLVDVSLVLLIIFIVTINHIMTPFAKINLPQSAQTAAAAQGESIDISISNEGIVYLDGAIITLKDLKSNVGKLFKSNPSLGIVFNVDKSVYFQRVIDVLDVLTELGISKLDIRTVQK